MVVFKDQETDKHRIGYLIKIESDALLFQPDRKSSGADSEATYSIWNRASGTSSQLIAEPEVDYLDVAALEIARGLTVRRNVPSYHAVAIDVDVDELEEAVALSQQLDDTANDRVIDLLTRLNGERYILDGRKESARIVRRYAKVLHDELSSRLVQIGVPISAREEMKP